MARTRRLAIVSSRPRTPERSQPVVRPASVATSDRPGIQERAGWQHVKISRKLSSVIRSDRRRPSEPVEPPRPPVLDGGGELSRPPAACGCPRPTCAGLSKARLRAVVVSQAPGSRGTPSWGQLWKRDGERFLRTLLSQVPVPRHADQRGDNPAPLLPERSGDSVFSCSQLLRQDLALQDSVIPPIPKHGPGPFHCVMSRGRCGLAGSNWNVECSTSKWRQGMRVGPGRTETDPSCKQLSVTTTCAVSAGRFDVASRRAGRERPPPRAARVRAGGPRPGLTLSGVPSRRIAQMP